MEITVIMDHAYHSQGVMTVAQCRFISACLCSVAAYMLLVSNT